MDLIRNIACPGSSHRERVDLLVGGGVITAISAAGTLHCDQATVTDGGSLLLMPGMVDALTHPCGGGGEGGFGNRTSEISAETFARAGVLSPVGALGTDSLGRSLDVLYGTTMGLRARGIRAYMYTGAYRVPAPTLTGDIARDLFLVEPVIGVGEVAIADHRGTQPTPLELRRLAAECALGGILTGKGGTVMVHVGDGSARLAMLREAVAGSDLVPRVLYPTHVNRSRALLDEAAEWARLGGFVDITVSTAPELIAAGDIPAEDAVIYLLERGAPESQITCSSDAGGSLPVYDNGELRGLTAAQPDCLMVFLQAMYRQSPKHFDVALATVTRNPAAALGLPGIGRLDPAAAADLVFVDETSFEVRHVMGDGRWLIRDGAYLGQDL